MTEITDGVKTTEEVIQYHRQVANLTSSEISNLNQDHQTRRSLMVPNTELKFNQGKKGIEVYRERLSKLKKEALKDYPECGDPSLKSCSSAPLIGTSIPMSTEEAFYKGIRPKKSRKEFENPEASNRPTMWQRFVNIFRRRPQQQENNNPTDEKLIEQSM